MTNAPERVWTCDETSNIWIAEKQPETTEYVRADISQAAIAAAYERAAKKCDRHEDWADDWGTESNLQIAQEASEQCAEEIRALTPADALAALEAVRRDAQERAMVALRKIADMKPHHAGQTMNECFMQDIARDAIRDIDVEPRVA